MRSVYDILCELEELFFCAMFGTVGIFVIIVFIFENIL